MNIQLIASYLDGAINVPSQLIEIDNALNGQPDAMKSPRIRFNWGYHDAHQETKMGRPRQLVESGPQSTTTVSKEFSQWFYEGYKSGLADNDLTTTSSEAAWVKFVQSYGDREGLYLQVLVAEIKDLLHTFRGMDVEKSYILKEAARSAKMTFENC